MAHHLGVSIGVILHVTVQDPLIILLADGDTTSAVNNAKGHLFETFVAQILHHFGYEAPRRENLNISTDGVELDIALTHEVTQQTAIAECKAYSAPLAAKQLSSFYGKLTVQRFTDEQMQGFFFAIPRLTADGDELARKISSDDKRFRTLTAADIWQLLEKRGLVALPEAPGSIVSDQALVVHASGIYSAGLDIDPIAKTARSVLVQSKSGGVHPDAIALLAEHSYAQGLPVVDVLTSHATTGHTSQTHPEPVIVEVSGSTSDFEYQLPASPKYFVGRRKVLKDANDVLSNTAGLFVLNAQSGWGKSSLALKIAAQAKALGGYSIVIDARTAGTGGYVPAVLRHAATQAEKAGVLKLGGDATWATLAGSLKSLQDAEWAAQEKNLVIIFDQFENVFRDEDLTREFRDLALWSLDRNKRLSIGFAWKTDYVSWTENHPYRLRDEIRSNATVFALEPFGPRDVEIILKRLEKLIRVKLSREIRQRLREYSQGLPWLLKKLSGHLIREIEAGKTQEQLVAEALNVKTLFESDLASLNPSEREALQFVARYAPIQAGEVTERFAANLVQSLLDQRLIVQVGEKLDTYWDTFRDYLNTGRAPIEDSYILRQTPGSVARLVSEALAQGGDVSVAHVTTAWSTSENVVWNVARELRQMGLASSMTNRVQLLDEIVQADDVEAELRRRVAQALRRHKAFSTFSDMAERGQGEVLVSHFAKRLPDVFPAVEGAESTWYQYARVFAAWFEYAGIAVVNGPTISLAAEGTPGKGSLVHGKPLLRPSHSFPTTTPGPVIKYLLELEALDRVPAPQDKRTMRALGQLRALGAIVEDQDSNDLRVLDGLVKHGQLDEQVLLRLLSAVPGGTEALAAISDNPGVSPDDVGAIFQAHQAMSWTAGTRELVGKAFRGWARAAGITTVRRPRQRARKTGIATEGSLSTDTRE